MKKRFNIITVTMLALVVFNIVCNLVYISVAFSDAYSLMRRHSSEEIDSRMNALETERPITLQMLPLDILSPRMTTINEKTGKEITFDFSQGAAYVDKSVAPSWTYPTEITLETICSVLWIVTFWFFIKFVRNINRIEIFTWKNVSLLRKMGALMLSAFALSWISGLIQNYEAWTVVALDGYMIDWFHSFDTITMVIGFCCLISAEVFAIGLRHQEELDLTV